MPYNWSIRTKRRLVPNLATPRNVTRQRDHRFAFSGRGGRGDGRGLSRSLRGQGRKLATSAFSAKPYCCLSVSLLFLFISFGHCRRLLDCETFVEASVPRFSVESLGSRRNSTTPEPASPASPTSNRYRREDRFSCGIARFNRADVYFRSLRASIVSRGRDSDFARRMRYRLQRRLGLVLHGFLRTNVFLRLIGLSVAGINISKYKSNALRPAIFSNFRSGRKTYFDI